MDNLFSVKGKDLLISTDQSKLDISLIHTFLSTQSYWAKNISFDVVKKSIENSLCFGIYFQNLQVGFARVVTDKATFAYLADVFILPEFRKQGLSKWLMQIIHEHPELQKLRRWMLLTQDAHALYEQFGWTKINEEVAPKIMQLHNADVYKKITVIELE